MPSLVERTLARLLVDRTITHEGGRWTFVGGRYRPARHEDTELIAARIARVKAQHREVLAAAAVLGHGLSAKRLAAVAGISPREAARGLAELAQLQILNAGEATRDPTYLFASRSLRNTIYNEIPTALRRELHDRAAAVVATLEGGSGRTEERTEHLLKGGDDDAAIRAAMDAGDRAAAVFADRRAIEYYARAYSRLGGGEDPRSAELALRLGSVFERSGELERAAVWYQAAVSSAREAERQDIEIESTLGLGGVAFVRGEPAQTALHAERALALIGASRQPRLQARAQRLLALVAMHGGDLPGAEASLLAALGDLEEAGADREVVELLLDLARLARYRGEFVSGVRYARRALHRARRQGEPASIAEAHTVLGRGFLRASRFGAARRALSQALHVARQSGDRLREAAVLREIGNLRTRQADFAGALERYNRSLELARAVRARADESKCLHNIGVVTTLLGQFRGALSALHAALDVANHSGDVQGAAYTYDELGHTYCQLGALEQARDSFDAAQRTALSLDDPILAAEARTLAAWVDLRRGNTETSRAVVRDVFDIVATLEDPADRAMVLLYAGRCAVRLGLAPDADAIAERLQEEIQRGVLHDFDAAATALLGDTAALAGDVEGATAVLEEALRLAAAQGLRPLQISVRFELGRLTAGTDASAEHLTAAMELVRDVVSELPQPMAQIYLSTLENRELQSAFRVEHRRVLA